MFIVAEYAALRISTKYSHAEVIKEQSQGISIFPNTVTLLQAYWNDHFAVLNSACFLFSFTSLEFSVLANCNSGSFLFFYGVIPVRLIPYAG